MKRRATLKESRAEPYLAVNSQISTALKPVVSFYFPPVIPV